jgi:hypothetical protein
MRGDATLVSPGTFPSASRPAASRAPSGGPAWAPCSSFGLAGFEAPRPADLSEPSVGAIARALVVRSRAPVLFDEPLANLESVPTPSAPRARAGEPRRSSARAIQLTLF